MAVRKIVHIDEELCDGCEACVPSCAEGAIRVINGKAKLLAENLCDGLGACLGECPQGAITVEEREADEFDEAAVEEHLSAGRTVDEERVEAPPSNRIRPDAGPFLHPQRPGAGCPGSRVLHFGAQESPAPTAGADVRAQVPALRQWPVQLHLVPPTAPYYQGADVLLAADCTAFALGDFHTNHLAGRSLAIACPKLDQGQEIYLEKLTAMIDRAKINTLTVLVMEVPCCGGLVRLATDAAARATRKVPVKKIVVGIRGDILAEEWI